jgi:site-specific DNA-methyltransferase (adenine-specific)/site-specific DNA-methyltransferase (cytosine-N4-specific)
MTLLDMLDALDTAGVRLLRTNGRLRLLGGRGRLAAEVVAALPALLSALPPLPEGQEVPAGQLLAPLRGEPARSNGVQLSANSVAGNAAARASLGVVTISGRSFTYLRRWAGQVLCPADGFLALDTETEPRPDDPAAPPPRLALTSVSSGEQHVLIHPDDLGRFLLAHQGLRFVCQNAAFDFWVVEQHLRRCGEEEARRAWWAVADAGRLHDTMLLDALVRLAKDDAHPRSLPLDVLAREYAGLDVAKDDPHRLRFAEIIGKDWETVEEGFFTYAIADAIVTHPIHAELRRQATALACRHAGQEVWPDAGQRFGLLTETLQVRKAIALAAIERQGIAVDQEQVRVEEADLRRRHDAAVADMKALCPELYKTGKDGSPILTKTGVPSKYKDVLLARLATIQAEIEMANPGVTLRVPLTEKRKEPTTSLDFWSEYSQLHPFLTAWVEVEGLAKLLQFFVHLRTDRVYPHYSILTRGGRTSASNPNIQQVPRSSSFRQVFVPSPGYLLLACDYSFIELRTLAAICLRRYGKSRLAEVILAGQDPHAYTAALIMLNMPLEEFENWKQDPEKSTAYKKARQDVKPINFGVPGSFGAPSLASYAKRQFGVPTTVEEAAERRRRLITEVYPELSAYLADDVHTILADTLRTTADVVRLELGDVHLSSVRKVLEGDPKRVDGEPYKERFVNGIWTGLQRANKNPELADDLRNRATSKDLSRKVCMAGVATLTGRIRGRVRYSQARNTPFQGLAADGAALALFALAREGFRVVGFVHDEVLVELPDEGGFVSRAAIARIEQIMVAEMEKVLGGLPAGVESALSTRWSKEAKHTIDGERVLSWAPKKKAPSSPSARRDELVRESGAFVGRSSNVHRSAEGSSGESSEEDKDFSLAPDKTDNVEFVEEFGPFVGRLTSVHQFSAGSSGESSLPAPPSVLPPTTVTLPPAILDVLEGRAKWGCAQGDCLSVLASLPPDSVPLVFGSPPYVGARLYLEEGRDLGIARDTDAWVAWMVQVYRACLRICTGLVAFVVEGQTKNFSYDAAPFLLAAELKRAGICLRKPPIYRRVGIPGSGSKDWLRNDYEFIVCATRGGQLPWSNPTACGHPPKYKPGGAMSYRTVTGERCNASKGRGTRGKADGDLQTAEGYKQPKLANPGNVIDCRVGGGRMGSDLAHKNEAPFPEELAEFFVKSYCPPDDIVLDPFAGSGTTLAVALRHGRRALGIDLRPSQVELTQRRVEAELAKGANP